MQAEKFGDMLNILNRLQIDRFRTTIWLREARQMIKPGDFVKIEDIGPLAQVLKKSRGRMYLRLAGEEFWCPVSIIRKAEV